MLKNVRKLINPPYLEKDIFAIMGLILILLAIPLTVIAARNNSIFRSKAAGVTHIVGSGGLSTISEAVAVASSGDIIQIKMGTYNEQVTVNKAVTIEEYGDGDVWVSGACTRTHNFEIITSNVTIKAIKFRQANEAALKVSSADNITIDGVTIQDYNCANGQDQYRAGVASWGGGKNLTVKNSTITRRVNLSGSPDGYGNGIWVKNTGINDGGGHHFANNTIVGGYDGIGGEPEDVSYGSFNKDTIIENNTVTDCGDDGIQSEGGNQNVIIRNNTIKRCLIGIAFTPALTGPLTVMRNVISEPIERYGLGAAMFKMGDSSTAEVRVYHNSFYAGGVTADGAKQTNARMENVHFRNNAIYASRYIFETTSHTGQMTANYDALYTTDSDRFVKWDNTWYGSLSTFRSGTGQEQNGISNSDFGWNTSTLQLQSGSPLIDAGVIISGINDNYSGLAPDIGAFEYDSGGGGDTNSPVVTISSPTNGSTVSGAVNISSTATDNVGVTSMEIKIDNNPVKTCSAASCSFSWDTTTYTDTSHTILVTATDVAGNLGSTSVTVTVDNAPTSSCDSEFPNNKFHVCFFDGVDPTTGTFIGERDEGTVSSPAPTIATPIDHVYVTGGEFGQTDTFSGIWRGNINFPDGNYIFTVISDDGVRLDVGDDGTQEIDEWFQQAATTYETVPISINGTKKIKLSWYEGPGDATITFGWRLDEENDNTLNVRSEPPTGIAMDDGGVGNYNGTTNYTKTSSSNISTWINAPGIDPPGYTFVNWTGCDSIWSGDDKWCRVGLSGGVTQTATAHYIDTQSPSTPTNLSATATSSRVDLSWTASTDNIGVKGYWVIRDGVTIATTSGTTYQDTTVSPSITYSYQVIAYDAANNLSASSNTASVTTANVTDSQAPTVPTGLSATAVSSSQINLSWTASTDNVGVTGYEIYRNGIKISTVSTTSYGDGGLSSSTAYSYFVKARDGAGNVSGASSTVSATTQTESSEGTVVGQVTSTTSGNPVVGATVTIKIAGGKGKSALVTTSTTNSSGVYAVNLDPGDYDIEVKVSGYRSQKKTTTITSGTTITVNFSLDPKGKGGRNK